MSDLMTMRHPGMWKSWPVLALRRVNGGRRQDGTMIAMSNHMMHVFLYHPRTLMSLLRCFNPITAVEGIRCIDYASYEDIVADGWEVDPQEEPTCFGALPPITPFRRSA